MPEKLNVYEPLIVEANTIKGLEYLKPTDKFVFKRLNIKERLEASVVEAKYKKGEKLDILSENIAYILSLFTFACMSKPDKFEFEDLVDVEPLLELYQKYSDWLNFFRPSVPQSEKNSSASTS